MLKNYGIIAAILVLSLTSLHGAEYLVIDDFNSAKLTNKLAGGTGCWNFNPNDPELYCKAYFDAECRLGKKGSSLRLEFDIDTPTTYLSESPHTGMAGYYTKLDGKNAEKFKYLVLNIKGDPEAGYTRKIAVELKDSKVSSTYILEGITDKWRVFAIPLSKFKDINNWSDLTELVINFDKNCTRKTGTMFFDNIYLSTDPGPRIYKPGKIPAGSIVTIDGDLQEWEGAQSIALAAPDCLESGEAKTPGDLGAEAAFLWDEKYLYAAISVTDDQLSCTQTGKDIYRDDCVELFIDPGNDGFEWGNTEDFQLGFTPAVDGAKMQSWEWLSGRDTSGIVNSASAVQQSSGTATYTIEAAVPWSYLQLEPRPQREFGLSVAVHDYDESDESNAKLNWSFLPDEASSTLGRIMLKGKYFAVKEYSN